MLHVPRTAQAPGCGAIVEVSHVGGLHHYERRRLMVAIGAVHR
jgi:hypothetical protein